MLLLPWALALEKLKAAAPDHAPVNKSSVASTLKVLPLVASPLKTVLSTRAAVSPDKRFTAALPARLKREVACPAAALAPPAFTCA